MNDIYKYKNKHKYINTRYEGKNYFVLSLCVYTDVYKNWTATESHFSQDLSQNYSTSYSISILSSSSKTSLLRSTSKTFILRSLSLSLIYKKWLYELILST
jgi:hypothetical protein